MARNKQLYALYKGDEILTVGTKEELAKFLGVTIRTIEYYSTPTYQKRNPKGNAYLVFRVEEGD